jgi:hypothetical protein
MLLLECLTKHRQTDTSEELDKQYVQTPEPTTHEHLQSYLHNRKKNEFAQPIHNISKTCKTKTPQTLCFILIYYVKIR